MNFDLKSIDNIILLEKRFKLILNEMSYSLNPKHIIVNQKSSASIISNSKLSITFFDGIKNALQNLYLFVAGFIHENALKLLLSNSSSHNQR